MRRVDGGEKVAGLTRFAADLTLPGTAHARLVLSPHPHARIVRIDTSMQFGAKYEPVFGRGASATVLRSPAFAAHLSEVALDVETGRVEALMDYALPQSDQAPSIDVVILEVASDHGPFGARGVGEPPVVGVPAAIANAIADASGRRLTDLPITGEALWRPGGAERTR